MGLGDVPKAPTPTEEQYGRRVGRKGVAAAESDAALGVVAEEDAALGRECGEKWCRQFDLTC